MVNYILLIQKFFGGGKGFGVSTNYYSLFIKILKIKDLIYDIL